MSNESKAKPEEAEAEAPAAAETEQPAAEAKPDEAPAAEATADAAPEAKADAESKPEPANDPDPPKANAKADPEPAAEEAAADPAPDPDPAEPNRTAELESEVADLKDRLLRAAAEMENMRRRFEREMADARQYAVTGFAREVLSIGDNLGRALAAVPEEARKADGALSGLIEGVEMTERELLRVLGKHNVKRLEPHGEKFDPNFHQAMYEVEHDEAPHGTVVQVVQPGYSIGERVLRPAMVGIAKAKKKNAEPPAESKEKEAEASTADETEKAANS